MPVRSKAITVLCHIIIGRVPIVAFTLQYSTTASLPHIA